MVTWLGALFILLCALGCEIINPKEAIPAYIQVDSCVLNTNFATQGSNSHRIRDAWVFVNDQSVGTFQIPFLIPSTRLGKNVKLSLAPGIELNGSGFLRTIYPMYQFMVLNTNLSPDSITKVNFTTSYFDGVLFPLRSSFDDLNGVPLAPSVDSDTNMFITSNPSEIFEGFGSGKAQLLRKDGLIELESVSAFSLPKGGTPVYAEFDLKSTHSFSVGVIGMNVGIANSKNLAATISATPEWKKIYVNLTPAVSSAIQAVNYKFFIGGTKNNDANPMVLLIDNLKIVYSP